MGWSSVVGNGSWGAWEGDMVGSLGGWGGLARAVTTIGTAESG